MSMRATRWFLAILLSTALLAPTTAFAGGDPDDAYRAVATFDLQGRNQPLGSVLKMSFFNEYEFMRDNVSPFFDPVWLRGGANVNISPAYGEVGLEIAISPIRLFELRMAYMATYYFGSLYYIFSFDGPDTINVDDPATEVDESVFPRQLDDDGVDAFQADEATDEESGYAHRLVIEPTIQVALGKIAMQNKFTYIRSWHPEDQFDGEYVREPIFDRILQTGGDNIFANQLILLYKIWDPDGDRPARMLLGPFHEWTRSTEMEENTGYEDVRHRLGLTYVAIPKANFGKALMPRFLIQVGYNLVDRENNREGHIFVQGGIGFNLEMAE
jgi:hypothetical protein